MYAVYHLKHAQNRHCGESNKDLRVKRYHKVLFYRCKMDLSEYILKQVDLEQGKKKKVYEM